MQKQQEMLEQQKKMQEQHRMEKELMENERLEKIKNKKDGGQREFSPPPPPWPLTSTEQFTVQGHNNRNPSLISQFFIYKKITYYEGIQSLCVYVLKITWLLSLFSV